MNTTSDLTNLIDVEPNFDNNHNFTQAFEHSWMSICLLNIEGKFLKTNIAFRKLLGYSEEEITTLKFSDITFIDDIEIGLIKHSQMINGEIDSFDIQKRYIKKNGEVFWANVTPTIIRQHEANSFVITYISDISHQKNAEEEIRKSEEKHRLLFETMSQGVIYYSDKGEILQANPAASKILGLSHDDMVGKGFFNTDWKLVNFDGTEITNEEHPLVTTLRDKKPIRDMVIGLYNPITKENKWLLISQIPIIKDENDFQIYATFDDITDRVNSQIALEENEKKLSAIIENSSDAIGVHVDGILELCNQKALNLFGYDSKEELIGTSVVNIIVKSEQERVLNIVKKRDDNDSSPTFYITKGLRRDGTEFDLEVNLSSFLIDTKRHVYVTLRDITLQRTEEMRIKESESKFYKLFHSSPIAMTLTNLADNTFVDFNDEYLNFVKCSRDEVIGKKSSDLGTWVNPGNREIVINKLKDNQKIRNVEQQLLTKDGNIKTVLMSAEIIELNGSKCALISAIDISEQKAFESKLIESELKYRVLFDTLPIGVTLANKEGHIIESNKAAESILGLSIEEQTQREIDGVEWNIIRPDGSLMPSDEYPSVKALKEKRIIKNIEMGVTKGVNDVTWINLNAAPLDDHGVVITYEDMTIRKKIEMDLKVSEARFTSFMEHMPASAFIKDLNGRNIYLNPHLIKLMGFENWENKLTNDLLVEEYATKVNEDDRKALENGMHKFQEILEVGNGDKRIFETTKFPIKKDGKNVMLGGIAFDITDRILFEDQLNNLSNQYRVTLNTVNIGISHVKNRIIIHSNDAHDLLFGYEIGETEGMETKYFYPDEESSNAFVSEFYSTFEVSKHFSKEYKMKKKSGELIECLLIGQLISPENPSEGSIWMVQDITERKNAERVQQRLIDELKLSKEETEFNLFLKNVMVDKLALSEEKLKQINQQKDKFFSIIAHDLRSPFSGFLGLTKIMAEEIMDLSINEMTDYSRSMQKSAENLYKLLENLLEWSRIQRGVFEFNPEPIELISVVNDCISVAQNIAEQKEIEFIIKLEEDLKVEADKDMLNSILRNLISNAVKFTSRGGQIVIGTSDRNMVCNSNEVCIFVQDSGIGMDSEIREKLFKLDEKVSRPGTENEPSTGLGLLLCKEFVEKNGGWIDLESEVDKGSTFYFTLSKALA